MAEDPLTPPAVAGEIVSGEGSIINDARAAAQYGRADEITQLLDDGKLTPDAKDEDGCSLLQWAAIKKKKCMIHHTFHTSGIFGKVSTSS